MATVESIENIPRKYQKFLKKVVEKTKQNSFLYAKESLYKPLLDADLVEINSSMVNQNDKNEIGVRATIKGIELVQPSENEEKTMSATATANANDFEIDEGVPIPKTAHVRTSKYPTAYLNIGQSFHVVPDNGESQSDLLRRLAGVVAAANNRYKAEKQPREMETIKSWKKNPDTGERETVMVERPVTVQTRKFVARRVFNEDPKGKGVRVFRTE